MNILLNRKLMLLILMTVLVLSSCTSKQDIETHMRNAQLYEKDGKPKAAIIELKNVLQDSPDHKEARKMLGKVYLQVGNGVSAEKELGRAIELGAAGKDVSLLLAKAQIMQGKFSEALENISLDQTWPTEEKAMAKIYQGDALFGKGDIQSALSSYQKALSFDQANTLAMIGVAKVAVAQRDLKKAEDQLASIPETDKNAVEMLLVKAEIAKQQLNFPDVEKYYTRAYEISKRGDQQGKVLNIQGQLVIAQLANNKPEAALENANQLLKASPNSPYAKYLKGLVAYQLKDYDAVFEYLLDVLSQVPEHLPSTLLLGAASYATGNYEQANNYLTTFVNKVPTHIHARKLLGVVRLRLNRPEEAAEVLKSASKQQQDSDAQLLAIIGQAVSASGDTELGVDYLQRAKKVLPDNASIRAELAKVYLSQGAYDKAISELEGIKGAGKNKAKVLLVYSHLRNEDFTKAQKIAAELVSEEPENPAWQVVAGGVELIAGNRTAARKYFNEAISMKKDFVLARINLARMEYEDGNLQAATDQYDKILVTDDKNMTALLGMAQVAERYGDTEQAVSWLEKARSADKKAFLPRLVLGRYYFKQGKYNESLTVAREAEKVKNDSIEFLRLIAASLIKLNRGSEAIDAYKQVIANDADNPQWYFEIANIHRGLKNINLAKASYKKALTLDKNFLPAKVSLVELDIQSDNLQAAMDSAKAIKQKHPKSSAGYLLVGDVYVKQKELKKAQQSYIDGYNVDRSLLLVNKIFLLSNALKNYDTSIKIIQDWLKKHPTDNVSRMYLGLAYQATNKFDVAEKEYLRVLDKQPKNIMALNNMAYLLIEKDSAKALGYAEKASELSPDNFAVLDTYGWVLTKNGKYEEGLDILQKALDKSNGNLSVQFHYAVALSHNNQKNKAVSILSEITSAEQDFPELSDARNLLKKLK